MAYNWNYTYVGGVPRVRIATGEDIAHLSELDEKLWTVLSCPVKGLQIDQKSLEYIDTSNDSCVHVTEVVACANWLTKALKNPEVLTSATDTVALSALNTETEEGQQVLAAAKKVLALTGKADSQEISLADSSGLLARLIAEKLEETKAERAALPVVEPPYGAATADIAATYATLDAKVRDHFRRSHLASFAALVGEVPEVAAVPEIAADATEEKWVEMGEKLAAYAAYTASQNVTEADVALDEEAASIQLVDKFLHLTRDFFTLLRNFVTLADFYNPEVKAIFQAGTLYIDQRACHLCLRVTDAGAMVAQAAASNLFLVFCTCQSKVKGETMDIVAAVTVGDTSNIMVGKNAIFYDRQGHDWDARVTNIIDNPISIRQAALSPYKKFASFIEEKVRSMAQKKESSVIEKAATSVDEKTESAATNLSAAPAAQPEEYKQAAKSAAGAFDIAKFAGIFAAIGMALGFIGSFITSVVTGFLSLTWWQMPLCLLAIFLLISGPSMFLAWLKLRKRNLAPVLNANGWAVNAAAMISIRFGVALTEIAKFPLSAKMRKQDPFADKDTPWWKKALGYLLCLLVIVGVMWYFKVFEIPGFFESPYDPTALTQAPDTAAAK